jgi:hypothetical protein
MNLTFVCAKQEEDGWETHKTVGVMRRCTRCDKNAVAGYWCDTCEHEDVDPADQLTGHGEGKCEMVAVSA